MNLTTPQLAKLLAKASIEPRRNQKRYLRDLGGDGSATELDEVLAAGKKNKAAVSQSRLLIRAREITQEAVRLGSDARLAEMIAAIRLRMEEMEWTQTDLANVVGCSQPLVSKYLSGHQEPGSKRLAEMADAIGCKWVLMPEKSG